MNPYGMVSIWVKKIGVEKNRNSKDSTATPR